ncbi:amidohydrolase family protein [Methylobrevis pamukkalensis]|uniref:N-isopropylammelide isopropyl amidohydrolase n=1 Tax=Methylobrevis pamukkalensis TaxID=1439726 RepID=A0A1E3H0X6_9HYPH|nr:amidohydrolase family protein [Methylobrevis pamukkalensis]ODN69944.1 N-isopropylammelide isopropyl amidohydrolase [Methylobrevis pamukkalensis]
MFDLIFRQARTPEHPDPVDVAIAGGRIAAIAPRIDAVAPEFLCDGGLLFPGFVDSHIHLDKACIADRCQLCEGTLAEAIAETGRAKRGFTREDVTARGRAVLERAIMAGTTAMRTHVEIDPRIGLTSFDAITTLKQDFADLIDLQICVFPQEGLTNDPGTEALLDEALQAGANLLGGCPYTDTDPKAQIRRLFDLATRHGVDLDFHLDFDLDPAGGSLDDVIAETTMRGYGGRVAVGHATKLSALPTTRLERTADRLAEAGVAVTVLPATDLYLTGRDRDHLVPRGVAPAHRLAARGVTTSIATNNVLNPFTPFGDANLMRMANLYANVAQVGTTADLARVFGMVSTDAARLIGREEHRVVPGAPADLVLLDAVSPADAVARIAQARAGWKAGRQSFEHPLPRLVNKKESPA